MPITLYAVTPAELALERARCLQAFDTAIAAGGYGPDTYQAWSAYVNRDILLMFGTADWIGIAEVGPLYQQHASQGRYERYPDATWRNAGNLLHYARALGIIVDAPDPERGRGWRLVDRQTRWIVEGKGYRKRAVQVRGLPPAEQAAQYKREATARKRAATDDRKARHAADEKIASLITRVLSKDPSAVVPAYWLPQKFVPDWLAGERIDKSSGILRDIHHAKEMSRPVLKEWIGALEFFGNAAAVIHQARLRERAALPDRIELPAADDAALEALL